MDQTKLLAEYDITVFHDLYDFQIARTILAQLGPAVTVLGDVGCAHGLQEHVGANLLHKHFDLQDGEHVVRHFEGRVAMMRPKRIDSQTENVFPYLWQLAYGSHGKHFYPLEFMAYENHMLPETVEEFTMIANNMRFFVTSRRVCGI